ncbi:hypothetical protein LEP1GSC036_1577 [Leptospira weilii str. 2006001853]|uniref:Uncharacterized protein n=1 Tax=Leptospira weilii str. 2006001853 TaxID=1001589 RepID=A0A828YYF0_9LEPT|nr:hypothetical protein LEP1GSC036_1577 [Leptospira weilii str. 2006001853]
MFHFIFLKIPVLYRIGIFVLIATGGCFHFEQKMEFIKKYRNSLQIEGVKVKISQK